MFLFGHWLGTNLGFNNVASLFLLSRKINFKKFQFNFKFSKMQQLVCYDHSTGCSFWGGEGGVKGLGKKRKKWTKKQQTGEKFSMWDWPFPPLDPGWGTKCCPPWGRKPCSRQINTFKSFGDSWWKRAGSLPLGRDKYWGFCCNLLAFLHNKNFGKKQSKN